MGDTPYPEAFLETLGCLITGVPQVRLAHFTIAEYLGSSRLAQGPANMFYLPASEALKHSIQVFYQVLKPGSLPQTQLEKPLSLHSSPYNELRDAMTAAQAYCRGQWPDLLRKADTVIASQRSLAEIVFASLDPRNNYYRSFQSDIFHYERLGTERFALENEFPNDPDIAILINLIHRNLYATTTAFLLQYSAEQAANLCAFEASSWRFAPLLGWLAQDHHDSYLLLLLERCGDKLKLPRGSLLIWAMVMFSDCNITLKSISTLLSAKVPANPHGVRVTPLQLAAARLQCRDVKLLLENGADPNAIGQPDGWCPPALRHFQGGKSPLALVRDMKKAREEGMIWDHRPMNPDRSFPSFQDAEVDCLLVEAGGREFSGW